jgi:hypothetical protein
MYALVLKDSLFTEKSKVFVDYIYTVNAPLSSENSVNSNLKTDTVMYIENMYKIIRLEEKNNRPYFKKLFDEIIVAFSSKMSSFQRTLIDKGKTFIGKDTISL